MSLLTEQFSSTAQNQVATQLAFFQAFSLSAFGGLEKLIALNLAIARQSLDKASQVTSELLAVKEPQELLQFGRTLNQPAFQPSLETLLSYGRELASISRDTRTGIWQALTPGTQTVSAVAQPLAVEVEAEVPAISKPVPVRKKAVSVKPVEITTQLPLLAEPEVKPVKALKPATKTASKPVPVNKTLSEKSASPAAKVLAKAPAASKKTVAEKPVAAKSLKSVKSVNEVASAPTASATPVADVPLTEVKTVSATALAATKAAPVTKAGAKPAGKKASSATPAKPVEAAKPAVESKPAEEKKSAVKFPFPVASKLKTGTPAFPKAAGKPAYKAKSSAATGAKKPVRQ